MKKMLKQFTAIAVSLAIFVTALPWHAYALGKEESNANTDNGRAYLTDAELEGVREEGSEAYVLSEIESKREPNAKYYRMSDGSIMAAQYSEPVHYEKDGQLCRVEADKIFYAVGMTSEDALYFDLEKVNARLSLIGDAKKVGKVDGAVHGGFFAALDIGRL